ncbi:MAG: hypothetical protein ACREF4_14355 [Gammaproteobacteria bacterium]
MGRAMTVRSDAAGRFEIRPAPAVPFSVLVVGPRGDVHAPMDVEHLRLTGCSSFVSRPRSTTRLP